MHRAFPPPTQCLCERETRIVEPALVDEFGSTIWSAGPRQRGNGVDHPPQWVFRFLPSSVSVFCCVGVHTLSSFRQSDYEDLVLLTLSTIQNGETDNLTISRRNFLRPNVPERRPCRESGA